MRARWITGVLAAALFVAGAGRATAQDEPALEEAAAYGAWYQANEAKDVAKAYELAREYVQKFPKGQYAEFLTKWVAGARGALFNQALQKKDMAAMLKLGQERLAEDPDDLAYLVSLALNLRRYELFASPANFTHAAEAADFSKRAIALIEAGKVPGGADPAKWNKNDALGWLHQNLAAIAYKDEKKDDALAAFQKSTEADKDNAGLVAYNLLYAGFIHKDRYDAAVKQYQELPEADRQAAEPTEAAKAAVEEANRHADAAIESWARFAGLAEAQGTYGETRERIARALAGLWAYRNPEDPEGYLKLIEQHKAGATAGAAPGAAP